MNAEDRRARTEVVRDALVAPYLEDELGRRLLRENPATRMQIEVTVRTVLEADRLFAEWGEPFAFRDRFVQGMAQRIRTQLGAAEALRQWAVGGSVDPAELRRRLDLDTPPEGV